MGTKLVDLALTSNLVDSVGNLTAGNLIVNSDRTGVGPDGVMRTYRGTRINYALRSNAFTTSPWSRRGAFSIATTTETTDAFGGNSAWKVSQCGPDDGDDMYQTVNGLPSGPAHIVSFYIKRISTSGTLRLYNPGNAINGTVTINLAALSDSWTRIDSNNSNSVTGVAITYPFVGPNGGIHFRSNNTLSFYLCFVQLEVLPSGNVIGSNLVTNGTFDTDANWTKGGGATAWTIDVADSNKAEKGAGDAGDLSSAATIATVANDTYQVVFTVERTAGTLTPKIGAVSGVAVSAAGTYTQYIKAAASNATLTFSADADFAGSLDTVTVKNVPDLAYLSPGQYTATSGSSATIPAEPRYESNGLLVEPVEVMNHVLFSENIALNNGYGYGVTVTANSALSPAGTMTADSIIETAITHSHQKYFNSTAFALPGNTASTFSVFVKPNGRTYCSLIITKNVAWGHCIATFNLSNGSVLQTLIVDSNFSNASATCSPLLSNGFYRISITTTSPYTGLFAHITPNSSFPFDGGAWGTEVYAGDVTKGIYVYGSQFEESKFPTSYIPTSGCPVTRLTEVSDGTTGYSFTKAAAIDTALGVKGTLIFDFTPGHAAAGGTGTGAGIISFTNSATGIAYYDYTNTNFESNDGTNVPENDETIVSGTTYTVAVRWDETADGGAGFLKVSEKHGGTWTHGTATAFDGAFTTTGTKMYIGYGAVGPFWIRNIRFFDGWVADANLDVPIYRGLFPILPWDTDFVKGYTY